MKLLQFYVNSYRVLNDLEILFHAGQNTEPGSPSFGLDFLVGLNGSGKSTVLQAIVDIFLKLERDAPVPFGFELTYELGEGPERRKVHITNRANENGREEKLEKAKVLVNGNEESMSSEILPSTILVFSSGSEAQWLTLGRPDETESSDLSLMESLSAAEKAIKEIPGSIGGVRESERHPSEESRFWLMRTSNLPAIALSGLLEHIAAGPGNSRLASVLGYCAIKRIGGFSVKFRTNEGQISQTEKEEILRLKAHASRSLNLGSDKLLVFDLDRDPTAKAQRILEEFGDGFRLFQTLARMSRSANPAEDVLQEINIFLERLQDSSDDVPPLHLFDWLSDGEQSFLARMCLFNLLGRQDALILLDEPEVHFNDFWKRQIVNMIHRILHRQNSHVLISTHSSIALSDVPSEDIVILERAGSLTRSSKQPRIPTLAADPGDIMVHVFEAPYAAGQRAVERIRDVLEGEQFSPQQRRSELKKLSEIVAPGYWSYRIRHALRETAGAR